MFKALFSYVPLCKDLFTAASPLPKVSLFFFRSAVHMLCSRFSMTEQNTFPRTHHVRGTTKVGEVTKKVQERRLKWYEHVTKRELHYVGRRAMEIKVQERRKIGLPKRRWLDKVKDGIKEKGL